MAKQLQSIQLAELYQTNQYSTDKTCSVIEINRKLVILRARVASRKSQGYCLSYGLKRNIISTK